MRMVEVAVKKVDPQGRISIPIGWRSGWKSGRVVLIRRGNKIEVAPIEPLSEEGPAGAARTMRFVDSNIFLHAFLTPRRKSTKGEQKGGYWTTARLILHQLYGRF